jgi:hypothetical protein
MVPRLEVINEPAFPAIIIEIKVGANSRIIDCLVAKPTRYPGNKGLSVFMAVCIATTPPTKNDIKATIPREPIIKSSISRRIKFLRTLHLVNFPKVLWIIRVYCPMWVKSFIDIKIHKT